MHKLKSVVEREKALIGLLITLNPPIRAGGEGSGRRRLRGSRHGTGTARFRKIQILTVEELMTGARPNLPIVDNTAFRRAKREDTTTQSEFNL